MKLREYQELTSYIIPVGTNSGALAERFDELMAESSWVHLLEAEALFACALCWGLLCLFRSENYMKVFSKSILHKKGHHTIVTTILDASLCGSL